MKITVTKQAKKFAFIPPNFRPTLGGVGLNTESTTYSGETPILDSIEIQNELHLAVKRAQLLLEGKIEIAPNTEAKEIVLLLFPHLRKDG